MQILTPVAAAVILATAAGLTAQTNYFASPTSLATELGRKITEQEGLGFFRAHTQTADSTMPRGRQLWLTEIAWRSHPTWNYSRHYGMGRKWTTFNLKLGHTDVSKWSKTFARNYLAKGTEVARGGFSLPNKTDTKNFVKWGDMGQLRFLKPFPYNGKNELLLDFDTYGGQLNNGVKLGTGANYWVDGCDGAATTDRSPLHADSPHAPGSRYLPRAPRSGTICADSALPRSDAFTDLRGFLYSDTHPDTKVRGRVSLETALSHGMAPNAPFVAVMSIGGNDNGQPLPSKCNWLHVNMSHILFQAVGKADRFGSTTTSWIPKQTLPFANNLAGGAVYAQTSWNDSKTTQMALTKGVKIVLPKKPVRGGFVGCPKEPVTFRVFQSAGSAPRWYPHATDSTFGTVTRVTHPVQLYGYR